MKRSRQQPITSTIVPDILAFSIGIATAFFLQWQTTDLVWSLWLSSLVLGYLTLLSTIVSGVYIGVHLASHQASSQIKSIGIMIWSIIFACFMLGFFSLHFCGFHAGHATFLASFFPIATLPENAFMQAFTNPFLLWKIVFKNLFWPYGIFLIPALIAERKNIFAAFILAKKAVHAHEHPTKSSKKKRLQQFKIVRSDFSRPYVNVIRMHILIFFFAISHTLKIDSFAVFTVIYFVYFFPWKFFRKKLR